MNEYTVLIGDFDVEKPILTADNHILVIVDAWHVYDADDIGEAIMQETEFTALVILECYSKTIKFK